MKYRGVWYFSTILCFYRFLIAVRVLVIVCQEVVKLFKDGIAGSVIVLFITSLLLPAQCPCCYRTIDKIPA